MEVVIVVWEERDSSSDGMMCWDFSVWAGVIVDGHPEGVDIVVELVDLGSR